MNFGVDIMLIKNPEMFFIIPNKIFTIKVYHKSGIMLYSYDFDEKAQIVADSTIWGNIIIGLNHILSEFIDKSDKTDVIQTKNADIVVDYESELGYAIVAITNEKNVIVEKLLKDFSNDFKSKFKSELLEIQDLNRLINVSEFNDTKFIIEERFQLYL